MKKVFVVLAILLVGMYGCGKVEPNKARALVVSLIHTIDSGKYDQTSKYYTDEFNAGESLDARIDKYKRLKEAFGDVQSVELVSEKDTTDPFDRPIVELIYRVKHSRMTSLEAYSVVSQNGDYKVESQDINQEKE